jgi:hypothetical protein
VLEGGGSIRYQAAKWLYLYGSFTAFSDLFGRNYPAAQIYRLHFAGVDFHLSDSWRIWGSGGIDYSDYEDFERIQESFTAGIGHVSPKTSFSTTYQRGFTSAIGLSRLLVTDLIAASYGYRATDWMGVRMEAYYYRSEEPSGGLLETFSGGGGLDFSLRRDLFLTSRAYYQDQRTQNFSISGLDMDRFTAYLGLQYVWPARKR